ncbi:MAG: phenylalanine--tRNA ligase subunit alpha [Elusimicrobia bacterium RIFOXYB2_FULL_49_7]|nr:MAG: phenylalanine--tRNA ligase subunit alpha [Elusimicrobia bacterium RIFOXYB2_FULL_49_7]
MNHSLSEDLKRIQGEAVAEIAAAKDENTVYQVKSRFLGKKSSLSDILGKMASFSIEEKRAVGGEANRIKQTLEALIETRLAEISATVSAPSFDSTLPGFRPTIGRCHPLTQVMNDIKTVFFNMGFSLAEGPEVESDYYNFEALNTPKHHPARDMQDTFYITEELLLRTHTSPVQVRVMENQTPPIRAIMPGRVYRNEEISARSYCLFHQLEGLVVDTDVSFADLKGTLSAFVTQYFGSDVKTKFRPSFFPFTEPSAEVDVVCFICGGKGCPMCKRTGWLEIMGCGMVDPNVFKAVGIDNEQYTGFAFGMGIERIAILKYGIEDIRLFYENDIRFLQQFNG